MLLGSDQYGDVLFTWGALPFIKCDSVEPRTSDPTGAALLYSLLKTHPIFCDDTGSLTS